MGIHLFPLAPEATNCHRRAPALPEILGWSPFPRPCIFQTLYALNIELTKLTTITTIQVHLATRRFSLVSKMSEIKLIWVLWRLRMKQSWREVFQAFVCKKWNNLQKFNKCTWGIKRSILDHPRLGIHPTFFNNSLMAALIRWPLWASRTRPPGLSWRLSPGYLGLEKLTMCDWTAMKAERLSPLSSAWRYLWSFTHVSASRHAHTFSTKIFAVRTVSILLSYTSTSETWSWFSAIPSSAWRFHPMPIPSAKPPKHLGK